MLLALDTGTDAVTVALHDGSQVVQEHSVEDRLRHGELLGIAIDEVLHQAGASPRDLSRVAVGVGPGPYTGLRIGLVTATTMAAALGIEAVGVCTLDVIAAAVTEPGPFLVATDARRKEVYWARYRSAGQREGEPAVDFPATVATELAVAGNGPDLYPVDFPHRIAPRLPSAAVLASLVVADAVPLLPTIPLYLRRPDAVEPAGPKRVT
jgi:tRNA threonylcarbamoyl adenosine modification protein YeaZ